MRTKVFYVYDGDTKEYLEPYLAQESPEELDVYIAPKASTEAVPPSKVGEEAICFKQGAWVRVQPIPDPPPPPPTAQELEIFAIQMADLLAKEEARADVVLQYFVSHTPKECATYVQTNVTSLATARDVLAKLAMAVSVLA